MKKKLIKNKLPIQLELAIIMLSFIIIGAGMIVIFNSGLNYRITLRLQQKKCIEIFHDAAEIIEEDDDYRTELIDLAKEKSVDITLLSGAGRQIYSSDPGIGPDMHDIPGDFPFDKGINPRHMEILSHEDTDDGGFLEVRKGKEKDSQYLVFSNTLDSGTVVEIEAPLTSMVEDARKTTTYASIIAVVALAAVLAALYLWLHSFTKTLVQMNDITRDMARLNFDKKLPETGSNEIGQLARSINTLSTSLDATLQDLREKNLQLEKDIEHEKKLEEMRKQFVSNASHELKTPISIIQGYAEGIKLGMDSEEYADIIVDETVKMNRLVTGLLELSKYESGNLPMNIESFDLREFALESLERYDIPAAKNGITLEIRIPSGCMVKGDREKLDICLHNYVSNAFSHAEGEKKVAVYCTEAEGKVKVCVHNTGKGIAEEDKENIWDENRFGLGLSMVKAIMELHGGKYGAENTEDGVIFYFEIERAE